MSIRQAITYNEIAGFHEDAATNAWINTELANAVRPAGSEQATSFVQHLASSPSRQKALDQEIRQKDMVPSD